MTHLQNIEIRQKQSRARDFMFAAFVVMAAAIGASTLSTAAAAASTFAQR